VLHDDFTRTVGKKMEAELGEFAAWIAARYSDRVGSVLVGPLHTFPIGESELGLFLLGSEDRELGLDDVRAILEELERRNLNKVSLHLLTQDIALRVTPASPSHCVASPRSHPAMFLYLCSPSSSLLGPPLARAKDLQAVWGAQRAAELRKTKNEIEAYVHDPNLSRLPPIAFQEYIWQALQARSLEIHNTLFLTSAGVCQAWAKEPGLEWLVDLHREFSKDLDDDASDTERFYPRAIKLLRELYS
jgi:hypothetical protein